MFIVALFIIAKMWQQLRCPSVDKWINKLVHPDSGISCTAKKKNELSGHEKTWRNLKCTYY